jgi:hypothetical protein
VPTVANLSFESTAHGWLERALYHLFGEQCEPTFKELIGTAHETRASRPHTGCEPIETQIEAELWRVLNSTQTTIFLDSTRIRTKVSSDTHPAT